MAAQNRSNIGIVGIFTLIATLALADDTIERKSHIDIWDLTVVVDETFDRVIKLSGKKFWSSTSCLPIG